MITTHIPSAIFKVSNKPVFQGRVEIFIKSITIAIVTEINEEGVVYTNAAREKITLPAEVVVSAFGYKSYDPSEEVTKKYCSEVHVIGGAVKPGLRH